MSFIFGGGSKTPEPTPTPVPVVNQAETSEEEKKKIRKSYKKSTILTSAQGILQEPEVAKKSLLGQ